MFNPRQKVEQAKQNQFKSLSSVCYFFLLVREVENFYRLSQTTIQYFSNVNRFYFVALTV